MPATRLRPAYSNGWLPRLNPTKARDCHLEMTEIVSLACEPYQIGVIESHKQSSTRKAAGRFRQTLSLAEPYIRRFVA